MRSNQRSYLQSSNLSSFQGSTSMQETKVVIILYIFIYFIGAIIVFEITTGNFIKQIPFQEVIFSQH
jgi:hypothetical protein